MNLEPYSFQRYLIFKIRISRSCNARSCEIHGRQIIWNQFLYAALIIGTAAISLLQKYSLPYCREKSYHRISFEQAKVYKPILLFIGRTSD